jgi:23S rRNA U2552 (ribose-2'-O)-methylase RlmE/FtsJ
MSYFLFPSINYIINPQQLVVQTQQEFEPKTVISRSLRNYVFALKLNIDNISFEWDIYKKYTNPYEYIHTIVPGTKTSISKLNPISRSFYKLIEIYNILYLFHELPQNLKSFHLAEGPGGFIEAMTFLRNNLNDTYYGMTLIDSDTSVPGWRKSEDLLTLNKNIILEKGIDGTGNLFNWNNLMHCYNLYVSSMDFITGDGGIDYSIDFNRQETSSVKLIISQIAYAIAMQKKGGTFVLKIFDVFTQITMDILYLLSNLYTTIHMIKPFTSRYANSERYVVCKDFRLQDPAPFLQKFKDIFNVINSDKIISRILAIDIPYIFLNKLEECNIVFGQQQIENISNTLSLIKETKKDKIDSLRKHNIQKCIIWCQKNKIPYNKTSQSLNIFLASR